MNVSNDDRRRSCVSGGRVVFADAAEDCGILSSQRLCIRQQASSLLSDLSALFLTFSFNVPCFHPRSPTPCALKIADKIAEQFDNAVLLMVSGFNAISFLCCLSSFENICFISQLDSSKMSADYRVPPIVMYERKDSRWLLKDKHT